MKHFQTHLIFKTLMNYIMFVSIFSVNGKIGGSASTTIPPLFTRSWSNSNENEGMSKFFSKEMGSIAHSRAECSIFRVTVDIHNPTVTFYSGNVYN